jgi:hypothetical protein
MKWQLLQESFRLGFAIIVASGISIMSYARTGVGSWFVLTIMSRKNHSYFL